MDEQRHSASFRDPSGFIFEHEGVLYRQVEERYRSEYEQLMGSGLYELMPAYRAFPC